MASPVIAPATARDFMEFAGQLPPYRVTAWAARHGGKVIGLGGVLIMPDGARYAFMDVSDEARRFPKAMHKTGLAFMREVRKSYQGPIVATTTTNVPRANEWLIRLGFTCHEVGGTRVFIHAGDPDQVQS